MGKKFIVSPFVYKKYKYIYINNKENYIKNNVRSLNGGDLHKPWGNKIAKKAYITLSWRC